MVFECKYVCVYHFYGSFEPTMFLSKIVFLRLEKMTQYNSNKRNLVLAIFYFYMFCVCSGIQKSLKLNWKKKSVLRCYVTSYVQTSDPL